MAEEKKEEKKEEKREERREEKRERKSDWTNEMRKNPWMISTVVIGVIAAILLFLTLHNGGAISSSLMGQKAVSFINTELLGGKGSVTLNSVKEVSGLYEVTVDYNGNKVPVYFTLDGRNYIYGQLVPLAANSSASNTQTQQKEIPKTDKPVVDLYVMGFCPYGNQAEDTMLPVYNLLKSKIDFNVHYIVSVSGSTVSSLHGAAEVTEDEREACVKNIYGADKWFNFATYVNDNCGSDGSCWEAAATKNSLSTSSISSCVTQTGLNLMKAEEIASNDAGASGSPTLILNGVESTAVYQYGNSQAYLDAICSAFTTAPSECSQTLGTSSTTGAAASGGSCAPAA